MPLLGPTRLGGPVSLLSPHVCVAEEEREDTSGVELTVDDGNGRVGEDEQMQERHGSLHVGVGPIAWLRRAHKKQSVTYMTAGNTPHVLHSAGRDGYVRSFAWSATRYDEEEARGGDESDCCEKERRSIARCKGTITCVGKHKVLQTLDWIDQLVSLSGTSDFLCLGFERNDFVAFDPTLNQCVVRVECGGGHRSWGWINGSDLYNDFMFVYIHDRAVKVVYMGAEAGSRRLALSSSVAEGLHGREIVCVSSVRQH